MVRSLSACVLLFAAAALAQEQPQKAKPADPPAKTDKSDKAEKSDKTPAEQFTQLYAEWAALDKRLNELQDSYAAAAPAAREEIKKQYTELVARSTEMIPKLRVAAEAAYVAVPNKDADVTKTLIGIVAYDVRRDKYDSALKLAKLLEDNKCEEAVLYGIAGQAAYSLDDYETAEKYLAIADKAGKLDRDGQNMFK